MLTFPCPDCGKQLRIADSYSGKKIRCPACRHPFTAPLLPAPFDPVPQADPEPPRPTPPPPAPVEDEPLSLPLADDEEPAAVTAKATIPVQDEEDTAEQEEPADSTPARRKKKKKKRRKRQQGDSLLDTFYYYTGAFGVFPWVMIGLIGVWLLCAGVSFLLPPAALFLIAMGGIMYLCGYFWFIVTAFRDDAFHGAMCIITHFYWIIYLFLNMEETWRPSALMVFGIMISASGFGILMAVLGPFG